MHVSTDFASATPDARPGSNTPAYWDAVAPRSEADLGAAPWRDYCDLLHERLLDRWLGDTRPDRVLKTDLFDEVCGRGVAPSFTSRSRGVHAFDISGRAARKASTRHRRLHTCVADARRLAYREDCFDLVISNSTLDHFSNRGEIGLALSELSRVIAPGGQLVITLDNPLNPVVALRAVLPSGLLHGLRLVPHHVGVTLTARGLRRALGAAGLDVLASTTLMHAPRLPAMVLARWLDRRAGKATRSRLAGWLAGFECLDRLPSRQITGYYIAALARKTE